MHLSDLREAKLNLLMGFWSIFKKSKVKIIKKLSIFVSKLKKYSVETILRFIYYLNYLDCNKKEQKYHSTIRLFL